MNKKISVYIPVKNGEKHIEETIQSVKMQSFKDWQLIIKDNCSTDKTKRIVQKYLTDQRISLLEGNDDIGMIGNYNSCLTDIQSQYYMIFSHDDCFISPTALEKAYNILESNKNIVKVHCDMQFIDENSEKIVSRKFNRSGYTSSDDIAKKSIITVRNLYGIPLLIRTTAIQNFQYDPILETTADIDFSILIGKGQDIYHIPEQLIGLRIHKNNLTHGRYNGLYNELKQCAKKNNISINTYEKWKMRANDCNQRIQKKFFFLYLKYFR